MSSNSFDINAYGPLDHDDLLALVESMRGAVGAAELHGLLTAELCAAGVAADLEDVLREGLRFLGEDVLVGAADRNELLAVLVQTQQALDDPELSFMMLLPDDDEQMNARAAALAQWCQGFMYGFAVAEKKRGLGLSQQDEVAEMLQDFAAISQVDSDLEDADDQGESDDTANEQDLMHLIEYVRVAALNIYALCASQADDDLGPNSGPLTVH